MTNKDFFLALDALEQEKNISKEYFMEALQTALATAYRRNFDIVKPVEVVLKPEKYGIEIYAYQTVVEQVVDPDSEISLEDAKKVKKTIKLGDKLKEELSPKEFGRIAAGTAKQVITQRIREKEKTSAYGEFENKVDTLMTGVINRIDIGNVYVEFPGTNIEGIMMQYDQVEGEKYNVGDRIKVYVKKLRETAYGVQAIVSRSNAGFVKKLFELEVPEIQDGVVEIINVVREVGYRTKIAINSKDPNVDALGACVGAKGVRVNAIVYQLGGEKIDIIELNKEIEKNNLDIIKYNLKFLYKNGNTRIMKKDHFYNNHPNEVLAKLLEDELFEPAWLYCYKTKFWFKYNFKYTKGRYHEDFGLTPLILQEAETISSIDYVGYNYIIREGSIMNSNNPEKNLQKFNDCFNYFKENKSKIINSENINNETKYLLLSYYANGVLNRANILTGDNLKKAIKKIKTEKIYKYLLGNTISRKLKKLLVKYLPKIFIKVNRI